MGYIAGVQPFSREVRVWESGVQIPKGRRGTSVNVSEGGDWVVEMVTWVAGL